MFQENEFRAEIARRGLTIKEVAKMLGIDPVSLYRKMKGKSDFFRNEIQTIREKFSLTDNDVIKIFFA